MQIFYACKYNYNMLFYKYACIAIIAVFIIKS